MKESNLKAKLGVALLLTVFSLNAIHAFNDYGVKENKLNYEVIAQSSSSGGVKCRCGAVYGKGCKADNSGSTCTRPKAQWWNYNQNCSK